MLITVLNILDSCVVVVTVVVLAQIVFEFKQLAHKNLSKRYRSPEQLAVLRQATLLDVRLRDFAYIDDPTVRAAVHRTACADAKEHAVRLANERLPSNGTCASRPPPAKRARGDSTVMNFITSRMKTRPVAPGPSAPATDDATAVERELAAYNVEPNTPVVSDDPILFWKLYGDRWPLLASVATKLLAIPVTSMTSEGLFSKAGMAVECLRASMSPDMVQQIMFLNKQA